MSQENVELVRRMYYAFNAGDLDRLIDSFSVDRDEEIRAATRVSDAWGP
jgi:ketosteroid isomerase-like protein